MPDLRTIVADYANGVTDARDLLRNLGVCATVDADGALKERFGWLFRYPRRCMYDSSALAAALREAGFTVTPCAPYEGNMIDLATVEVGPHRLAGAAGSLARAAVAEGTRP